MATTTEKKGMDTDVIDLSINTVEKKRFRINGDSNKILELHTSDVNIIPRLKEGYDKLTKLHEEISQINIDEGSDGFNEVADALRKLDTEMRKQIDYIFDSNVSEICAPFGSMYDLKDGKFVYEHIIETLAGLYGKDLSEEFKKLKTNTEKHTAKYTKAKRK